MWTKKRQNIGATAGTREPIDISACPPAKLEVWTHPRGQCVGPSYARTKRIAVQPFAAHRRTSDRLMKVAIDTKRGASK